MNLVNLVKLSKNLLLSSFMIFLSASVRATDTPAVQALGLPVAEASGFSIWSQVQALVANRATSYSEVVDQLDKACHSYEKQGSLYKIAGGLIEITPRAIKSYANLGDEEPEFSYEFGNAWVEAPAVLEEEGRPSMRVAVDIIPAHQEFNHLSIGNLSYGDFVLQLQSTLKSALESRGAEVTVLRPKVNIFDSSIMFEMNNRPFDVVISTQFNNDHQDAMVVFCAGNISRSELLSERQRARLVHALLSRKVRQSYDLGLCILNQCQATFGVQALGMNSEFGGNACPFVEGVSTRNLAHNGLFAGAVVVPFPDMQWVRSQVQAGQEAEWIQLYANALTEAVFQ